MLKSIIKLYVFTLFFSLNAFSQEWAPIGAKWTFEVREPASPALTFRTMEVIKDTIVLGKNCKEISFFNANNTPFGLNSNIYSYEESDMVYWYNDRIQAFTLLYDFNKNSGESWITIIDTCELIITVDSTGIDTINGFYLKTQYVSSENNAFNGKVIQFIGNTTVPLPDPSLHCWNIFSDNTYIYGLRCYEDEILGSFQTSIAPSCDFIITTVNDVDTSSSIKVYPTPSSSLINISCNNEDDISSITVFDIQGKRIKSYIGYQNIISIEEITSAEYILQLQFKNGNTYKKKVLKY